MVDFPATLFPATLDEAIAQAQAATQAALAAGYTRLEVNLAIPELKPMEPAYHYLSVLSHYGSDLKVFFTDAGAAALARRNWGDGDYSIQSIDVAGSRQTSTVEELITPTDQAFLFVAPSAVEVLVVEQLCNAAGDRPVVLFNPRLEDVGTVGIGYTARKLRDRFLSTIEPCYYLKPLSAATLLRCYPSLWQVWAESDDVYTLFAEETQKPTLERLDELFVKSSSFKQATSQGPFANLQRMLKALGQ